MKTNQNGNYYTQPCPRSWYMALYCTCTVTLCAGIWSAWTCSATFAIKSDTRDKPNIAGQFQQLETLEWQQAASLQQSAHQLQSLVQVRRSGRTVEHWQRVAHEWRTVQAQQALHQQVQQQLLAIVLCLCVIGISLCRRLVFLFLVVSSNSISDCSADDVGHFKKYDGSNNNNNDETKNEAATTKQQHQTKKSIRTIAA